MIAATTIAPATGPVERFRIARDRYREAADRNRRAVAAYRESGLSGGRSGWWGPAEDREWRIWDQVVTSTGERRQAALREARRAALAIGRGR